MLVFVEGNCISSGNCIVFQAIPSKLMTTLGLHYERVWNAVRKRALWFCYLNVKVEKKKSSFSSWTQNWLLYNLIQDKITSVKKWFIHLCSSKLSPNGYILCTKQKDHTTSPDIARSVKIWQLIFITVISFQF